MKILFAGTPDIAVPSLIMLAEHFPVAAVLTAPDKVSGRGRKLSPPPVKTAAENLHIPVLQPPFLNGEAREAVSSLAPDILVVFAYGKIFGPRFLALFPQGGMNLHPSSLPRYRGPSPLTAALLAGDSSLDLTVQKIALEMDAGDILLQAPLSLGEKETAGELSLRAGEAAAPVLVQALNGLKEGSLTPSPQDHSKASYCSPLTKADGCIPWDRSALKIERMIRAYTPWPRARTTLNGKELTLLQASVLPREKFPSGKPGAILGVDQSRGILVHTGEGILGVERLQLASRKPMDFRNFINGVPLSSGMLLGETP